MSAPGNRPARMLAPDNYLGARDQSRNTRFTCREEVDLKEKKVKTKASRRRRPMLNYSETFEYEDASVECISADGDRYKDSDSDMGDIMERNNDQKEHSSLAESSEMVDKTAKSETNIVKTEDGSSVSSHDASSFCYLSSDDDEQSECWDSGFSLDSTSINEVHHGDWEFPSDVGSVASFDTTCFTYIDALRLRLESHDVAPKIFGPKKPNFSHSTRKRSVLSSIVESNTAMHDANEVDHFFHDGPKHAFLHQSMIGEEKVQHRGRKSGRRSSGKGKVSWKRF